jgi:hypothetical protein
MGAHGEGVRSDQSSPQNTPLSQSLVAGLTLFLAEKKDLFYRGIEAI